jgi:GH24 family phage-related lysozyme (muramidase)
MCSLAYNIGVGAFGKSDVLVYHRSGLWIKAAKAFLNWDHVHTDELKGLLRRRLSEAALYLDF